MKKHRRLREWTSAVGLLVAGLGGCDFIAHRPALVLPPPVQNQTQAVINEKKAVPIPDSHMASVPIDLGIPVESRLERPQPVAECQEAVHQDAKLEAPIQDAKLEAPIQDAKLEAAPQEAKQEPAPQEAKQEPVHQEAKQEPVHQETKLADACLHLGIHECQQGRFAAAEEFYKKALSLEPGTPDIYFEMGYALYLQHRLPEAEMNLRQAIALQPGHSQAHSHLALVLNQEGRREEALQEFRKAGCNEAEAHANLAFVLILERYWEEAQVHFELALALDPTMADARKGLLYISSLLEQSSSQVRGVDALKPADTAVEPPEVECNRLEPDGTPDRDDVNKRMQRRKLWWR